MDNSILSKILTEPPVKCHHDTMVRWFLILNACKVYWKTLFIVFYPLLLLPMILSYNTERSRCVYVLFLMAGYWISEVFPLAITSLIPMVLFPLMGVMDTKATSICYMKDAHMLFLGGIIIAMAISQCKLHVRISLQVGCSLRRLNFAIVTLTMLLSMWISNTAAASIMLPLAKAILEKLEKQGLGRVYQETLAPEDDPDSRLRKPTNCTMCFYISTAYAATIGGIGTIVGSGTNVTFISIYETEFNVHPSFGYWFISNTPVMLVITYLSWVWMQIWFMGLWRPNSEDAKAIHFGEEEMERARDLLITDIKKMGPITTQEILVGVLCVGALVLCVLRQPEYMKGWPEFVTELHVKDATPTMIIVLLIFILPSHLDFLRVFDKDETKRPTKPAPGLLTWDYFVVNMHWRLLFIAGGGYALAEGIRFTKTDHFLVEKLHLVGLSKFAILVIVCLCIMFLTQFIVNTAVANLVLYVIAQLARKSRVHPMYLMMPATVACSFAFCLPVSTPPNVLVFSSCNIGSIDMIKVGLVVELISFLALITIFPLLGSLWYDFDDIPEWAEGSTRVHD